MSTEIKSRPIIAMIAVESSQIAAIGHDPETNTLAIQFPSKSGSGSLYHYSNFDVEAFAAFKNAESLGSHFGKFIKPFADRFPYEKVSAEYAIQAAPMAQPVQDGLFVTVPEVTLPNGTVVPSFQVAKYLSGKNEAGSVIITETAAPWVEIDYHAAKAAAESAGFKLITETQYLALAHDIARQGINWTGGAVGHGALFQGLRNDSVDEAQPGTYEPEDPDERRWFELSNGERIYDVAGNAYSWVFDDVQGDEAGIVARAFAADSPSISNLPAASMEKGVGWYPPVDRDWSSVALVRGGCWSSGGRAGVFFLDYGWPDLERDSIGFRCTKP